MRVKILENTVANKVVALAGEIVEVDLQQALQLVAAKRGVILAETPEDLAEHATQQVPEKRVAVKRSKGK